MKLMSLFVAVATALTFVSSCGKDDNNNNSDTGVATTQSSPTPTPSPTPVNLAWSYVYYEAVTDIIDAGQCDMPFKFKVDHDGAYRAGPCTAGENDFKTGKLTDDERMQLDQRARAVAAQSLKDKTCSGTGSIAGSFTQLKRHDNLITVYRSDPEDTCYRGTQAAAQDLHYYLGSLSAKYYPKKSD
jgi:hypothetical protein